MRTAVIFTKRVRRGDIVKNSTMGYTDYPNYQWLYSPTNNRNDYMIGTAFLPPGTYTVSAELTYSDTTVRVCTFKERTAAGKFPTDGWESLPYTFTLTETREVSIDFFREGGLTAADVTSVRIHDTASTGTEDVYEARVMHPEEIGDSCTFRQEVNSKSWARLRIFPQSEAWQFCERSLTYVRILDLDKPSDRLILRGRVTGITDRMERGGKMYQEATCASALDFLEDTPQSGSVGDHIENWLTGFFKSHNESMDDGPSRKLIYSAAGLQNDYRVYSGEIYSTKFEMLKRVFTSGENLSKYVTPQGVQTGSFTLEFRERYYNDLSCIDIAESFGEEKDTPIKLGENLIELQVDKTVENAVYTAVEAVSGVNSDGSRYSCTVSNEAMSVEYGTGRTKSITCDSIRCTAPMWDHTYAGGAEAVSRSSAQLAMRAAVEAYAKQEAAKLSDPPVKLTLNALDLAQAGMTGYEPIDLCNSYPVVHPGFRLHGKPMRVTALTRRLSDGKIESLTIEHGQALANAGSGSMSYYIARLEEANRVTGEETQKQVEIIETKIEEQTDNYVIEEMTQEEYDDAPTTSKIKTRGFAIIRDSQTGESKLMVNGTNIDSGGSGGGSIEYAAILTEEEMSEWAPEHELTPLWFRGSATVYYGQAPARFVVQGNRVLWGATTAVEDDIAETITLEYADGRVNTYRAFISNLRYQSRLHVLTVSVAAYDSGGNRLAVLTNSGALEFGITPPYGYIKVGMVLKCSSWSTGSDGKLYPNLTGFQKYVSVDGVLMNAGSSSPGSGSSYGMANPVPCTDAERDFGLALTTRTEPVAPS